MNSSNNSNNYLNTMVMDDYPMDDEDAVYLIQYMKERFCLNYCEAIREIYNIP